MIWRANVIIMIEIKCVINVMLLNHPQTTAHHYLWKNCFPRNQSLVPKRLGTAAGWGLLQAYINSTQIMIHKLAASPLPGRSLQTQILRPPQTHSQSLGCSQGTWPSPSPPGDSGASKLGESLGNAAASLILIWIYNSPGGMVKMWLLILGWDLRLQF